MHSFEVHSNESVYKKSGLLGMDQVSLSYRQGSYTQEKYGYLKIGVLVQIRFKGPDVNITCVVYLNGYTENFIFCVSVAFTKIFGGNHHKTEFVSVQANEIV